MTEYYDDPYNQKRCREVTEKSEEFLDSMFQKRALLKIGKGLEQGSSKADKEAARVAFKHLLDAYYELNHKVEGSKPIRIVASDV